MIDCENIDFRRFEKLNGAAIIKEIGQFHCPEKEWKEFNRVYLTVLVNLWGEANQKQFLN